jgi:hypothetical protein
MTLKKFTDEDLLAYYNRGLSDHKIANLFGCDPQSIGKRRRILKLVANYDPRGGKRNTAERNEERIMEDKKCACEYVNKNKIQIAGQKKEYYNKNKVQLTEYRKKYRNKNKVQIAGYQKKYRNKNKDIINKKERERYLRNKQTN